MTRRTCQRVEEIVDRAGWSSGNSMAFIVTGTGSRSAYSYNSSTTLAPKLFIAYNEVGTPATSNTLTASPFRVLPVTPFS